MKKSKAKLEVKGTFLERFYARQTTEALLELLKENTERNTESGRIARSFLIQELRNNRKVAV